MHFLGATARHEVVTGVAKDVATLLSSETLVCAAGN